MTFIWQLYEREWEEMKEESQQDLRRTINSKSAGKSLKSIYIYTKFLIKGSIHISKT